MARAILCVVVLSFLAGVVAVAWWLRDGLIRPDDGGRDVSEPTPVAWADLPDSSSATERVSADFDREGRLVVLVRSAGVPVKGVRLTTRESSQPAGWLDSQYESDLGVTSEEGQLDCSFAAVAGRVMTARVSGYQVAEVAIGGQRVRPFLVMELERAASLVVLCATREGMPVDGVEVSVSGSPLPEARPPLPAFSSMRAVGAPRAAIFTATSGADGAARFDMLAVGRVFCQIHHRGYSIAAGAIPSKSTDVGPGENTLEVMLDPILGAFAVVVDDPVLTWSVRTPPGALVDARVSEQTSWIGRWWSERYASSVLCFLAVPEWLGDQYSTVASEVEFSLLAESYGACSIRVPVRRVDQWSAPDLVQIGTGRSRVLSSEVRIRLLAPSGHPFDGLWSMAMQLQDCHGMLRLPLGERSGQAFRVPNGRYRLSCSQPFLKAALNGREFAVAGDRTIELDVPMELRECRITWETAAGAVADEGVIRLSRGGEVCNKVFGYGLSDYRWVLPVGVVSVDMKSEYGAFRGDITIPSGDARLDLTLRLGRE